MSKFVKKLFKKAWRHCQVPGPLLRCTHENYLFNDVWRMKIIEDSLQSVSQEFHKALEQVADDQALEQVRLVFLSRNGKVAHLMNLLKDLSSEDKRVYGPQLNALKQQVTEAFTAKQEHLAALKYAQEQERKKYFDVTAYTPDQLKGSLHPYTLMIEQIEDIVTTMGFEVVDSPEVDNDFYNFEALNIPQDHPARDMHDTFWLDVPSLLLRTHTSNGEIHALKTRKLPVAIIIPGRCYRHEATDASHDFMFMQCEGLLVDKNISMANLFATIRAFLTALFEKKDLTIRMRPSYFPFVEPGVEVDMSCPFCTAGCSTCKHSRWIEICGAGLTHPNVLRACGIDPEVYSGFAFGFGLTRLVMLKYGINDIRLLHDGKIDFLKQF